MKHPLFDKILAARIVAILRGLRPEEAVSIGEALAGAGFRFLEVPLNAHGATDAIRALSRRFAGTEVHIGAGTVLRAEEVDAVLDAGAEYVISPNVNPAVIRCTHACGLLSMPGFQTPTEAFTAVEAGADVLKVFPCGTPHDIAVLKTVVPLPIFAVGAIDADNIAAYLKTAAGAAVGIGVYRPGMTAEEVGVSARRFLEKTV